MCSNPVWGPEDFGLIPRTAEAFGLTSGVEHAGWGWFRSTTRVGD